MRATQEHSFISARDVRALKGFDVSKRNALDSLSKIGINISAKSVRQMMSAKAEHIASAMDSLQPTVTAPSIGTPVQFLQNWLPGFVFVTTGARKIDDFVGIMTAGSWEDEQVVQGVLERTGKAIPYGDYTNVPLSSWNTNYNYRTVVRFEEGMKVGNLEAARSARMQVDDSGTKREAAALSLEIIRNDVGFNGFNNGANQTYGFLNAPELLAYNPVPAGAGGGTEWSTKTFLEIAKDIRTALSSLRSNSQDTIDPESVDITLAVATDSVDWLSTTSDFGISVRDWLRNAYPRVRVTSAPQLNAANAGDNVFYMYAETIQDASTDGGRVWLQPVPTKFQVMGVQQLAKSYEEDYSNATAGVMCKRPFAVVRYFGV